MDKEKVELKIISDLSNFNTLKLESKCKLLEEQDKRLIQEEKGEPKTNTRCNNIKLFS
jgi:hypothetical protein